MTPSAKVEIRKATPDCLKVVGRLRYEVYVEEMGREEPSADHEKRLLLDVDDFRADVGLFVAWQEGAAIGTVRVLAGVSCRTAEIYGVPCPNNGHQALTTVTGKLVVSSKSRGKLGLAMKLSRACYEWACNRKLPLCLIDSNPPLLPMYKRQGFVPFDNTVEHPTYGTVYPMVLFLPHLEHLRRVKSPFVDLCERFFDTTDLARAIRIARELGIGHLVPPEFGAASSEKSKAASSRSRKRHRVGPAQHVAI